MDETVLKERLTELEVRLALLESEKDKGKDKWDIFNIIASLLIPASIAFSGYYFSNAMKQAEIDSSEALAARQAQIAIINAKVGQAELISEFLEPLTGENEQKKRVAIRGILIALPEDGPQIVNAVSESDPNAEIQEYARSELDLQREQLIRRAFDDEKPVRIAATTDLIRGWSRDVKLVPDLIAYANQHLSHKSGVINTLVILQNVDINSLRGHHEAVLAFTERVRPNGPQTAEHADKVKARL
jgi:hypothetical protein